MNKYFSPVKDGLSHKRQLEFFHHHAVEAWGGKDQMDSFALLHPLKAARKSGLYVVLHSAGHDLYSCLGCTFGKGNHDIYCTPDDLYGLYLDCRENEPQDFWWGGIDAHGKGTPDRKTQIQPVEKRVYDTIEWVMRKYPIDKNRIYISGNSMGGSGALGLGMCRGDLFAAVKANVPAGVEHMLDRISLAGKNLPDPPVCIDYSAQNDTWSNGHGKMYKYMREHKFALYGYWGTFGHANNDPDMLAKNDLIHSLDWLSIRKNQAYPVFTHASSDNPNPWENDLKSEKSGQVNAFFRWENLRDRKDSFSMRIFLVSDLKTTFTIPQSASADISLRRLQNFKTAPHEKIRWSFGEESGITETDANGLLTLPRLTVSQTAAILQLSKVR